MSLITPTTKTDKELSRLKESGAVTDACEILERRFGPIDPAELRREKERVSIGCQIYEARKAAGISQRALAAKIGTTASAICRLENADYERYSVPTLKKVADALGMRLEISLVPERETVSS